MQRLLTRERATSMGPKKRLKADKNQRKLGFFFSGSEAPVGPTDLSENEAAATDSACVSSDVSSSTDSRSTQVSAAGITDTPKKKQRQFQEDWKKVFPWLRYDKKSEKMFCIVCQNLNRKNRQDIF